MTDNRHPQPAYDVRVPAPHEGIGQALRGAYSEPARSLPNDMTRLLDKLR